LNGAYGYRPRRSGIDAVKEVHRQLCRGYTDVVDADLLNSVRRRVVDRQHDRHRLPRLGYWPASK
jgi:RNA-directed DNA polymerase